jgi:putative hemolysin
MQVHAVSARLLESFPVQVHVVIEGSLPDGCTAIDRVDQRLDQEEKLFWIEITTVRVGDDGCPQGLVPFEEVVPLDVQGLPAGIYVVDADGVRETFTLEADNAPPDAELPNPASRHCQGQGYRAAVRSDETGNQYGVCIFPDGSECGEWAFLWGECRPSTPPADDELTVPAAPEWQTHVEGGYGYRFESYLLPQELSGPIEDWRVAPDGTVWLITGVGVGSLSAGVWTVHPKLGDLVLGFDEVGRTWVISAEGDQVAAWDTGGWTTYGPEAGWTPVGPVHVRGPYANVGEHLVTDERGQVWLVTAREVRAFDGRRWTIYTAGEVGFSRTEEMIEAGFDFRLTEVSQDSTGDVWVADCAWMGPGPRGQGARWFNGEYWDGQDSPVVASGCIEDIEVDGTGRIWVGVDGVLWRYSAEEKWISFTPPDPDPTWGRRWGNITDIELQGEDTAWVTLSPCGGASCDTGVFVIFRVQDGVWTEVSEGGPGDLAFATSDEGWLCAGNGLYHITEEAVKRVFEGDTFSCGVGADAAGRVWLTTADQDTLWLYSSDMGRSTEED